MQAGRTIRAIAVVMALLQDSDGASASVVHGTMVLPPLGFTLFCRVHPDDCVEQAASEVFSRTSAEKKLQILEAMNQLVNSAILPYPFLQTALPNERWLVMPYYGYCYDYAITKRHQLLRMGWPSSALQLAEVRMKTGVHHLVLVVAIDQRGFVLDNLDSRLTPIELKTDYTWLRVSSSQDPASWLDASVPDR